MALDLKEMIKVKGGNNEVNTTDMERVLNLLSAKTEHWDYSDSESDSDSDGDPVVHEQQQIQRAIPPKPATLSVTTRQDRRKELGLTAKKIVSSTTESDLEKTREKERQLASGMSTLKQLAHRMGEKLSSDNKLLQKTAELTEDGIKATSEQQKALPGGVGSGMIGSFFSQTYETIRMAIYLAACVLIFMFVLNIIIMFPGVRYVYIEKPP
eukprot:TRINITY_DN7599_c1_g1_i6.p1 TRINITY_DN7599_c1_g1~~TRINITY_DN7599_c1_g1_i6.p1  ORF type:complete len:211 (+),score=49.35 TRINITY_DN7599_c1_g1_i6:243-875(+)